MVPLITKSVLIVMRNETKQKPLNRYIKNRNEEFENRTANSKNRQPIKIQEKEDTLKMIIGQSPGKKDQ